MKRIKVDKDKVKWTPGAAAAEARAQALLPKRRHETGTDSICLVIDGMNLAYMAYYAYSRLSVQGKSTAILFGLPNMIKAVLQRYRAEKVIVCWDGKKHPARIAALKEYKQHREKGREANQRKRFLKEISRTRQLLHRMGIAQAWDDEVEGDDMIYMVSQKMQILYRVIIVSGDKDFKQLVNHDVQIYNPRNQDIQAVFAFPATALGLDIMQYVDFLCLVGDHSDDIPGIRGIGPKRASDFLKKYYCIEYYLKDKKAEWPGLVDKDHLKKIYRRNRLMIDLAYFYELHYKGKPIKYFRNSSSPTFDLIKYTAICERWQLKTMLTETFKLHFNK